MFQGQLKETTAREANRAEKELRDKLNQLESMLHKVASETNKDDNITGMIKKILATL